MPKIFAVSMKTSSLLLLSILLSGCEKAKEEISLEDACNSDIAFCQAIESDSRCKPERKELIIAHNIYTTIRDMNHLYRGLIAAESFVKCSELARHVEYINPDKKFATPNEDGNHLTDKELAYRKRYAASIEKRKSTKQKNYRNGLKELRKLEEMSSFSSIPELAYYHWSRHQDKDALKRLLKAESEGKINNYWLKYGIAQYYSTYEPDKALAALEESLSMYPPQLYEDKPDSTKKQPPFSDDGLLHFAILRSMAGISFKEGNLAASYIYAKVLHLNNDRTSSTAMILEYMGSAHAELVDKLDDFADAVDEKIENGELTVEYLKKLRNIAA